MTNLNTPQNDKQNLPIYRVSVNTNFTDKVAQSDMGRFNMTFQKRSLSVPALAELLVQGHSWTSPHRKTRHLRPKANNPNYRTTYRVKENVINVPALSLDFDGGTVADSIPSLLEDGFIGTYAGLLHTTASHTDEKPRSRVIFFLDKPLPVGKAELALKALLWHYSQADQSCKDACRVFYGATGCTTHLTGRILPLSALAESVVKPYQKAEKARKDAIKAERARELERRKANAIPPTSQTALDRWIHAVIESELEQLRSMKKGDGRHQKMLSTSLKFAGLSFATWHNVNMADANNGIYDALRINGYTADYGCPSEKANDPIIEAFNIAEPAEMPMLNSDVIGTGERVTLHLPSGKRIGGKVDRVRKMTGEHWELLVGGAWYPKSFVAGGA